ncbi:hypothetical protein HDV00_010224 [Rhizophlyctis rosea]|nr:hypothetical protein HDV00_010224 [Rhizophlyctis rosea]
MGDDTHSKLSTFIFSVIVALVFCSTVYLCKNFVCNPRRREDLDTELGDDDHCPSEMVALPPYTPPYSSRISWPHPILSSAPIMSTARVGTVQTPTRLNARETRLSEALPPYVPRAAAQSPGVVTVVVSPTAAGLPLYEDLVKDDDQQAVVRG